MRNIRAVPILPLWSRYERGGHMILVLQQVGFVRVDEFKKEKKRIEEEVKKGGVVFIPPWLKAIAADDVEVRESK